MERWSDQGKMTGEEVPGVVLVCTEEVVLEAEVMAGEAQEGAEVEAEEVQEVVAEETQEEEVLWRWGEQQGDQGLAEVAEEVKVEEEELAEEAILGKLTTTMASIHRRRAPVKLSRRNASSCKN